ncbi:MAG TPA: efflux RND transporter periplasmic adaptor subunit [Caulobacterales bacterium]|nr:efflux RND transporter periplasmic adaptor subunit [Caulobacterales bacterium]
MKPELFIKRLFQRGEAQPAPNPLDQKPEDADGAKRQRRLIRNAVIVGVGVIAVIYAISHWPRPGAKAPPVDSALAVSAVRVAAHEFHPVISITGEARPQRDIHVFAPASGVRVLQLLADAGDRVRAGQPLARLDTALSTAQLSAAQANVANAEAAQIRARSEYERAESIRDSGALSTEAIEQRRAAAAAADAQLAAARAQLAEVNARLQGGYVRAPIAGTVISRSVELGAMVDQQEMFRIAGGDALEVAAQIAEADVLALQDGQVASFQLVDGSRVQGTLSRKPASIDSRTRTGEALFALPLRTQVRAGMHLSGELPLGTRSVLAAPQTSVLYEAGQPFVFVIDGQNRAIKTAVTLGQRDQDWIEIVSGLKAEDRIVGAGASFLRSGDRVRPIERAGGGAALDLRGRSNG